MKADPHRQWRLLDLQRIDTRLAQIAHKRRTLPQASAHDEAAARLGEAQSRLVRASTERDDVQREVAKAEADVQLVRGRLDRDRQRLDSGQGTSRDLQNLQHEIDSLVRRQGVLEEEELEIMERVEGLDTEVSTLTAERDRLDADVQRLAGERDVVLAELADEETQQQAARADVAAGVGDDLLSLYEKVREQTGMGAAALTARRCGGCNLELLGADLRRVAQAPADEVVRCEECRRILVRTGESGL